MATRIRTHVRSNVVGYVAIFLALTGGAYAVTTAPRNSVVSASIKDGEVKPADIATGAVSTAKFSPTAIAPNAAKLGGRGPGAYQRRVSASCGDDSAITAILASGAVSCGPSIDPVIGPQAAGTLNETLARTPNVEVAGSCEVQPNISSVSFYNRSGDTATLNWIFSEGGSTSTVNASGNVIAAGGHIDFSYNQSKRLEGQWIFSGGGVTTVNLHAFDGGGSCEVRGTAVYAPTS